MAYMPLNDAYKFHKLISKPALLPITFAQRKNDDLGSPNLHEEDDEEEWEHKSGSVTLKDSGVTVSFMVRNYSVLWAKAEKHCVMQFMCDPIKEILSLLGTCDRLLHLPPADALGTLENNVEQAKRELVFAMYQAEVDPHDVIRSLYRDIHTNVYQEDCVHCDPRVDYVDEQDPPDTMLRLSNALTEMGFDENGVYLDIDQAKMSLMCAQGHLEAYLYQYHAMHNFLNARQNLRVAIQPVLHDLHLASNQATVIGVASMDLLEED